MLLFPVFLPILPCLLYSSHWPPCFSSNTSSLHLSVLGHLHRLLPLACSFAICPHGQLSLYLHILLRCHLLGMSKPKYLILNGNSVLTFYSPDSSFSALTLSIFPCHLSFSSTLYSLLIYCVFFIVCLPLLDYKFPEGRDFYLVYLEI